MRPGLAHWKRPKCRQETFRYGRSRALPVPCTCFQVDTILLTGDVHQLKGWQDVLFELTLSHGTPYSEYLYVLAVLAVLVVLYQCALEFQAAVLT